MNIDMPQPVASCDYLFVFDTEDEDFKKCSVLIQSIKYPIYPGQELDGMLEILETKDRTAAKVIMKLNSAHKHSGKEIKAMVLEGSSYSYSSAILLSCRFIDAQPCERSFKDISVPLTYKVNLSMRVTGIVGPKGE